MIKPASQSSLLALAALLSANVFHAHAQTASQITPSSARPPAPLASGDVAIPELSGPEAPKGADRLRVRLANVTLDTGRTDMTGEAVATAQAAFNAALVNKTVTVAEIFAAARALEAAYGRAGFVLTRVVVPAQNLRNGGTLKVVVIAGFIERLETRNLPPAVKQRVETILTPLIGQTSMTLARIERALVLAGDTPGLLIRSTLVAGGKPGGSVLIVEGRHRLVSGSLSAENTIGPAIGSYTTTASVQVNSALGLGELFYGQISGYPNVSGDNGLFTPQPTNRQLAAGFVMPLGADGWSLNLEAVRTDSTPNAVSGQQFNSTFERFSGRLKYAIVRSRGINISNEFIFDAEQETLSALLPVASPLSLDRLRIFRDTAEISGITPWGAFMSTRLTGSLGINGLGARSAAEATALLPLSRQGSDAAFQKLDVSGRYSQLLVPHLGIDLFLRAQTSFGQALPRAEQIGLVGSNAISGFDAGAFQGDSGIVGRAELSSPWTLDLTSGAASLSPYVFGALGSIWLMRPTSVEREQTTAGSFGLGLRIGAAPNPPGSQKTNELSGILNQAILSIEWGRQYRNDGTSASDRITFSSTIQF